MKLSNKKKTELYNVVHEEIIQARIKIWKMRNEPNISIAEIDDILSDLTISAPKKAIDLFEPKKQYFLLLTTTKYAHVNPITNPNKLWTNARK